MTRILKLFSSDNELEIIVISTEGRNLDLQATPRFLMELLAIRLSRLKTAAKSLVIPSVEMTDPFLVPACPA